MRTIFIPARLACLLAFSPLNAQTEPVAEAPVFSPRQAVDALSGADAQQALELLQANFVNAAALSPEALGRATLQGLLERLGGGCAIGKPADAPAASPFRAEILDDQIGYIRLGTLDHLSELDAALGNFSAKNLHALILDLRATPPSFDFDQAAACVNRFAAKGKLLFAIRRPANKQERIFTSDQEPLFQGIVVTVVQRENAGAAEVIAGALRGANNALVVGQTTTGQAAEYNELPLRGGLCLRVAVGEVKLPQDRAIFPGGLKPDVAVDIPAAEQAEALRVGLENGVGGLIFETERPRFNEAALVAGENPELEDDGDNDRPHGSHKNAPPLYDAPLQRAVDLITTIRIFGEKSGK